MLKKTKDFFKGRIRRSKRDLIDLEIDQALKISKQRPTVYLGNNRVLTQDIFGHDFLVDSEDISLSPHIISKGYWELWISRFFIEVLEEGMNVLEIGSNIGYYTLLAASRVGSSGKVFGFEADPLNFDVLRRNIELNGFMDRVQIFNKAVLDECKTIFFSQLEKHHGSNSVIEFSQDFLDKYGDKINRIEVPCVALDDYLPDDLNFDLIKIDAEGSEPKIFRGMNQLIKRNSNVKIICEFAPDLLSQSGESPQDFLLELTNKLGFSLKMINHQGVAIRSSMNDVLKLPSCEIYLEKSFD